MKTVIKVKDLYKLYRVGDEVVHALDGLDFQIYEGEFCAIVGTSGSGKSTLLNMLAGLESDLQQCEAQLDNARVQLSNAKAAVDKPFPQEDELKTKLARLDELNILLNLDKRENEIVDCEPDESEPKEKKRDMER